ncbi:16S rRNA (cytidine(1402)-2'-O)-methyltransferase [Alkalicaulis satelles]|uniref:Ribosomal RNA small subunit methyltransferase I n=1 Tax=Alkalicaulis satelles TaxID=2609175 RepID=A0A5M6ZGL8_9PROT|nr:16S rRNA (cytidine(1402)-2'-O)-methyltransferase [Alkalicaulis satelles]KAA5803903.1 16S rRNA (cytidine(1402)-2'-O)-methyltransferase [Alkalicaulis satelles]
MDAREQPGTLYLVATPIGNLEDLTYRAARILAEADVIAAEDTRHTRKLLDHYGIAPRRLIACHDHNERHSASGIADLVARGQTVALCSDAGTPGVNDPGFRVVSACYERGLEVRVIPGASAVLSALVLSNLPAHEFVFLGFPPRKSGQRRNWLDRARRHQATLVMMEAPHRLPGLLEDALAVLGDIQGAVCLEITKMFELTERANLSALSARFSEPPRGEVMVVIDGASAPPPEPEAPRRERGRRKDADKD